MDETLGAGGSYRRGDDGGQVFAELRECASQVERGGLIELLGAQPIRIGEASDEIELPEEATDHVIAIAPVAEVIELRQRLGQCCFGLGERVFRIEFALCLQAAFVFQELLPIEVGSGDRCMYC
jgi:hypothetical protein